MNIAIAQINPLVGDISGNGTQVLEACSRAAADKADLVVAPELALWGYPPRDLLLQKSLHVYQDNILNFLAQKLPTNLSLLLGITEPIEDGRFPDLFNSIALVNDGSWSVVARKRLLPSYDVFDERRYFRPSNEPYLIELKKHERVWRLGLTICEDIWADSHVNENCLFGADPIGDLLSLSPDILINISASPFSKGKRSIRHKLAVGAATKLSVPVVYVNQVGANDELIFDGLSFVVSSCGKKISELPLCSAGYGCFDMPPVSTINGLLTEICEEEMIFRVLILGIRDYVKKCGIASVILGLSGGIDSSLVAVLAVAALGRDKVKALLLPSPWSSEGSLTDSLELAERLALSTETISINNLMSTFDDSLYPFLGGQPSGVTAENLQSRIRGTLLMAFANNFNHLLLTTGNKSELAVGYCTLYGDMNGGLSVIGDLYKTTVFRLCAWIDSPSSSPLRAEFGLLSDGELIGKTIRLKEPSAELRPDQKDVDSLPEYSLLDPLLKGLLEEHKSFEDLVDMGHDATTVSRIILLLRKAEFKRRQSPPVLKISHRAFGSGWRMPIASYLV